MNLLKAKIENFGSYKELEFDFSSTGLALIYGATGSGKSTIQDIALWILYGVTAKDGGVDEVKSWINTHKPTVGKIDLITNKNEHLTVKRTRGSSKQNDLLLSYHNQDIRGKDVTETQELLEHILGVTKETYLIASCYNEFSSTAHFFTAKAKERRELFENLADLSLPTTLLEKISKDRSFNKKSCISKDKELSSVQGAIKQLNASIKITQQAMETWEQTQKDKFIRDSERFKNTQKAKRLELVKKIVKLRPLTRRHLESICQKCGQPNREVERSRWLIEDALSNIRKIKKEKNPYVQDFLKEQNFHKIQLDNAKKDLINLDNIQKNLIKVIADLNLRNENLDQLADIALELRSILLSNTIGSIQTKINYILEKYFDGLLRVNFTFDGTDNVNVTIQKNSYTAVYSQLSKGQRSLLKLSFSVAVMEAAANKAGTHFDTLFFDEALDGLDDALKLKAFGLFQELNLRHNNILLIDHFNQLKGLFTDVYHVTIEEDCSSVVHE